MVALKKACSQKEDAMQNVTAVPNPTAPIDIYANRVSITQVAESSDSKAYVMEVNFGSMSSDSAAKLMAEAVIAECSMRMGGALFLVETPLHELLYSISLSSILPEKDDEVEVILVKLQPNSRSFGIVVKKKGALSEARILTPEDARPADSVQCESSPPKIGYSSDDTFYRCDREVFHYGTHQQFFEDKYASWTAGGSAVNPRAAFGIPTQCLWCQTIIFNDSEFCSTCVFWQNNMNQPKNVYIADGVHYRPGKGGFGGLSFTFEKLEGGTWTGEVFTQGVIPAFLRDKLPDNSRIVSPAGWSWGNS